MTNPYIEYYRVQAGSGLTAYEGVQYQRGHGFFGPGLLKFFSPILKWFGNKAVSTAVKVGSDFLGGKNIKDSLTENLKRTGADMLDEGVAQVKNSLCLRYKIQ